MSKIKKKSKSKQLKALEAKADIVHKILRDLNYKISVCFDEGDKRLFQELQYVREDLLEYLAVVRAKFPKEGL